MNVFLLAYGCCRVAMGIWMVRHEADRRYGIYSLIVGTMIALGAAYRVLS